MAAESPPLDGQYTEPQDSGVHDGQTIMEHLVELRNRVFKSAIAVILCVIIGVVFHSYIFEILLEPARREDVLGEDWKPAFFALTDGVFSIFKVGMYTGLLAASPVVIYQMMAFIIPGLTPKEQRFVLIGMFGGVFFLIAGALFAYFIILPISIKFLIDYPAELTEPVIGVKQYIDFVSRMIMMVALSFELPMIIAILARLGIVNARQLISFWRYALVLIFVVAAIVTPTPDPVTQSVVAGPLILLYGLGIFFAWLVHRPRKEPDEEPIEE
jgi:sec-independent protein translocase protein TatC